MIYSVGIETTGLDPAECGILEIAVACLNTDNGAGGVVSALVKLDPKARIEPGALKLHERTGLMAQHVAASSNRDVVNLKEWLRQLPRDESNKDLLVLWQGDFAMRFLHAAGCDGAFGSAPRGRYLDGEIARGLVGQPHPPREEMQRAAPKACAGMRAAIQLRARAAGQ